jgi:hypothetical protein
VRGAPPSPYLIGKVGDLFNGRGASQSHYGLPFYRLAQIGSLATKLGKGSYGGFDERRPGVDRTLGFQSEAGKDRPKPLSSTGSVDHLFPGNDPRQQPLSLTRDELEIRLVVSGPARTEGYEVSHTSKRPLVGGQQVQVDV